VLTRAYRKSKNKLKGAHTDRLVHSAGFFQNTKLVVKVPDTPNLDYVVSARQVGRKGAIARIQRNDTLHRLVEFRLSAWVIDDDALDTPIASDGDGDNRVMASFAFRRLRVIQIAVIG
jgi:hypothetical protein